MTKVIERKHEFSNRINQVVKGKKYFTIRSEKGKSKYLAINQKTLENFKTKNWAFFEKADKMIIDEIDVDSIKYFGKSRRAELFRCARIVAEKI